MYIGIDIGGTHTRVAIGEAGKYSDKKDFPTKELNETLKQIKQSIVSFGESNIKYIGVSVAGPINSKKKLLYKPPNLHESWHEKELAKIFSEELKIPTVVDHDASVVALGEAKYGAGKEKSPVLYYTVSTGIGTGLIIDGKIFNGIYSPEAGQQVLSDNRQSLESLSSGKALKEKTGKDPKDVEGTDLWEKSMEWVGIGIANSILHFSPEIVIVGGGMTKHGDIFFEPVKKYVSKYLTFIPQVPIVPSGLGQDNGIIGALELARQANRDG